MRFLGWLEESEAASHVHTHEVATFAARMSSEIGWSDATVEGCRRTVDCFFFWLDERGVALASVGITMIDQFITRYHARGFSRSTIHLYAQQLRRFFRFAEQQGWCRPGLADGIMPPRRYPGETIPKGLKRGEVIRLLATTESDRPCDIRARAILMLLITYGLRASEVSVLKLGDLDWEQEMLRVRCPKPGRTHLYPLSRGVGQSILRYLREVRPAHPERRLFLTMRAPIKPLSRGVIKEIVCARVKRLGITGKRRGPHALRHAAAQHLLDQGLSMKAVGDYLGHRSVAATSVYAKVQIGTLREVAEINLEELL
ncbi:MAG: tyrosine-type recombinase/integrase [Halieaceae bacterium]|nr:tyrosine-type recombinase/integrase [Halieaceae bacterium]